MIKLNNIFNNSKKWANPIIKEPVLLICLFLIINSPIWIYWAVQYAPKLKYIILAAPVTAFLAYVLVAIVHFVPKSKVFIYIGTYMLSIIEAFLVLNFGTRFSPTIFQLIAETTSGEIGGFFTSYLFTSRGLIYAVAVIAFMVINILVEKSYNIKSFVKKSVNYLLNKFFLPISILMMLCAAVSIFRDVRFVHCLLAYKYNEIPDKISGFTYGTNFTTFGNILYAGYMYGSTSNDAANLAEVLAGISNVSSDYTSKNVIFVLGESFSKHHSSLYGYPLLTNPLLEKEKSNLYVMSNVVSPHNTTSKCLRKIFSFSNQDNNLYWATTPLFPALYKYVGYNVTYLSNQECKGSSENIYDTMNNCFVNDLTIPYLYDYVNSEVYDFDMDLVKEYENIATTIATEQPKLVIFHLIGQHMGYNSRYPNSAVVFTTDDYKARTDLNDAQKEDVAHYDNATCYNDMVISSLIELFRNDDAIIIYLSDHGEEVCDYRHFIGRSHEPIITKGRAIYQYEVPLIIWTSDKYKELHPVVVDKIEKSLDRPFMTDDLPHLMLDIAGIDCEWFEPTRSLINDKYNMNRKRLLEDSKQDYDEIVKSATIK